MKKVSQYFKAASLYLFGNLFNKGIAFLAIPVFTRILTRYDYGIVNTYTSWVGIISMILGMTFHMGIRAAFSEYKNRIDDFMSSITFFSIVAASLLSSTFIIVIMMLRIDINMMLVTICFIQGFFMAMVENYRMYLMMKFEYKKRTLLLLLPNLIITIISIFAIVFIMQTDLYLGRIVPSAIVYFVFGMIIIVLVFKKSKVILEKEYRMFALRVSLPIILHGLSLNILAQSDRIMLTSLVGASETGVYSLVYNFSMITYVVIISLDGVWVPWFTEKLNGRNINQINDRAKIYIDIMTVVTCTIILLSPEVLRLIAPFEYWYGEGIIPQIVIASYVIFIYTLYVNVEHYHRKTKKIALNTILAAISNIILNLFLIPKYGIYGAATTTLISYMISFILHYSYSRKIERVLFPLKMTVKPVILIIATVIVYYVFILQMGIRWFTVLLILLIFCLTNRKNLLHLLKFN